MASSTSPHVSLTFGRLGLDAGIFDGADVVFDSQVVPLVSAAEQGGDARYRYLDRVLADRGDGGIWGPHIHSVAASSKYAASDPNPPTMSRGRGLAMKDVNLDMAPSISCMRTNIQAVVHRCRHA